MVPGFFFGEFFEKNVSFEGFIIGVELCPPIHLSPPQQRTKTKDLSENSCKCADIKKSAVSAGNKTTKLFLQHGCDLKQLFFVHAKRPVFFFNCLVIWVLLKILWKVLKEPFLGG